MALTLRVVGGLTSEEIARAFLVPVATVQAADHRAKKTLAAARVPFEMPPAERVARAARSRARRGLRVFTEGSPPRRGTGWVRPDLADEALRLAGARRAPPARARGVRPAGADGAPPPHGSVRGPGPTASRSCWRTRTGAVGPLGDPSGRAALARADALGRGLGPYALQAAIAECHASRRASTTPTGTGSCCSTRRSAVSPRHPSSSSTAPSRSRWRTGPSRRSDCGRAGRRGRLARSHLLPSVRGELLVRLGRNGGSAGRAGARRQTVPGTRGSGRYCLRKAATGRSGARSEPRGPSRARPSPARPVARDRSRDFAVERHDSRPPLRKPALQREPSMPGRRCRARPATGAPQRGTGRPEERPVRVRGVRR